MKTTIFSMKIRVKEIPPSDLNKSKDLFRKLLEETLHAYPTIIIQGLQILPKCVGITKLDRRVLFSGMAVRRAPDKDLAQLESDLRKNIEEFLKKNQLDVDVPDPIALKLYHQINSESEFVAGRQKSMSALQGGPKTSSQIADVTGLDGQLANILLCMLEEEGLVWREETENIDDIFHLTQP